MAAAELIKFSVIDWLCYPDVRKKLNGLHQPQYNEGRQDLPAVQKNLQ
jgi:hypothetical protein